MSFLNTRPEALTATAAALQALGSAMVAQNAAAAAPTTGLVPAAADEVSALQATLFAAYGTWYQNVSAQAAAIHQMLVKTLGTSAGSYGETESANQVTTGEQSLTESLPGWADRTGATLGTPIGWAQNFAAASSNLVQVPPAPTPLASAPATLAADAAAVTQTGTTGFGAAPVLAASGRAASVGGLSVPPNWAANTATSAPTTLTGAGWTAAAPEATRVTALPAGMPGMAAANRGGLGLGVPRYGVKPIVMPKPTVS